MIYAYYLFSLAADIPDIDAGDTPTGDTSPKLPVPAKMSDLDEQESKHFLARMVDAFWRLHNARPSNTMLAPACLPGNGQWLSFMMWCNNFLKVVTNVGETAI